jgi:endonuclease/exonuclease/phosphatase family metal-dependent hydrolase
MKLRLSTYNCENLFSRARLLQLADGERRAALMREAALWQARMAAERPPNTGRPGPRLLPPALGRYVALAPPGTLPQALRYRRSPLDARRCAAKGKVLRAVDADVQCLVEVEDRASLAAFDRHCLGGRHPYHLVMEGNDPRGCHLGLLSRLPLLNLRSHCFDREASGPIHSRDCLEIELSLPDDRRLHLLLTQFDGPDEGPDSDKRRRLQATAVAQLVMQRHTLARDLVAVLGDFNDSPQRASQCLAPLLNLPGLSDVLALQFPIPDDRWTGHRRRNQQMDYILASDALRAHFRGAGAERRGMPDLERNSIAREMPFDGVTTHAKAASSRAAVWADFEMP